MKLDQLLTATEAAALKKMSLNRFKYQIAKSGAPKPVFVGVGKHRFYDQEEVRAWKPQIKQTRSAD